MEMSQSRRTRTNTLWMLLTVLFLSACGTVSTKPVTVNSNSSNDAAIAYEKGLQQWQRWERDENIEALGMAFQHYKSAYQAAPQNSRYQRAFYLSSVYNSFYNESVNEEALLAIYQNLQSSIRLDVPPPARVSYALKNIQGLPPEILITHAQRAIQQQALDALSWKQLSEQYLKLRQPELATASAWRALELDNESANYHWQFAESLVARSQVYACHTSAESNLLLAAKHSAKAAAQGENKAWLLANSGEKYIAMGLLPLARHQVNRSLAIETNAANISAHIKTSLLEGREFQTEAFIEKAENTLHTRSSYIALAMASAAKGHWEYAEEFMTMAKAQGDFDIIDHSIYYWLALLAANDTGHLALIDMRASQNKEDEIIKNWLLNDYSKHIDFSAAFAHKNPCTKLKEDFYSAVKLWKKGNVVSAKQHLQAAVNSEFYNAREKIWAVAILQGIQK